MDTESRRQMVDHMAVTLVREAAQAGRDEMAQVLADWLTEQRAEADWSEGTQHYLDGIEDALCTLVQAGATDPRGTEQGERS